MLSFQYIHALIIFLLSLFSCFIFQSGNNIMFLQFYSWSQFFLVNNFMIDFWPAVYKKASLALATVPRVALTGLHLIFVLGRLGAFFTTKWCNFQLLLNEQLYRGFLALNRPRTQWIYNNVISLCKMHGVTKC